MTELYQITRTDGVVFLPARSLSLAVATKGNIHFSFKTNLKQEIPVDQQRTIERDIIERYDIKISEGKDADRILEDIMVLDRKVLDILHEVRQRDSEAQVRCIEPPILTINANGTELKIPTATIKNIDLSPANANNGVQYVVITMLDNKTHSLSFNNDGSFAFPEFIKSLQESATERLTETLDLATLGITGVKA